ncbi:Pectinesterase 2.1 [Spatholobus suberectus]|nr:Pectinesterase 2.1 [Spatholobus suberectus]
MRSCGIILAALLSTSALCLAVLVAVWPPKVKQSIDGSLNGDFPPWVTSKDRRFLESTAGDINANVVVAQDGSGNFTTVVQAVASAPNNSNTRFIIYVKMGTYKENVQINSEKTNVMLLGDGMNATIITGSLNFVDGQDISVSATVGVDGNGFIAQDLCFKNTAGPQKGQAVALRVGADRSVINRCGIDAFQDTLYVQSNRQFYRDSFVTGTIDFIFGDAAVVFQKCQLVARMPLSKQYNVITAQGRENSTHNSGISIQQCDIIPSMDLKPAMGSIKTFLGRPWKNFSRTVVLESFIDSHVDPTGWAERDADHKSYLETLYFGEYMNNGPGANTSKRVNWTGYHIITTEEEASQFTVKQLINGDLWLPSTGVNFTDGL